ncbi:nitronate monooxygenase [Corynebacterium sp. 13CS0277]|uniref:nitronate monooxygenase n=1 Tax=Corynebacterium sp. 13CS0277 TaxID=2071994 RepID=UPI00130493BA|nr:nitronate monooxygenase [Corynebacterium sp. 13CS0277]
MDPLAAYMFRGADRDRLAELIVSGAKTATVSRVAEYVGPLPKVGDREVVVDSLGRPVCLTENTAVDVLAWEDITWAQAAAEGEGHRSLGEYVAAHEAFWQTYVDAPEGVLAVGEVVWVQFRVVADLRGRYPLGARVPVVQAPMAGGPATPALAAAVCAAGGLGMLAGGYQSADSLRQEIAALEDLTEGPYGINLFVPASRAKAPGGDASASQLGPRHGLVAAAERDAAVGEYAARLGAAGYPTAAPQSEDVADYEAKLEVALASHALCVSFTFGIPPAADLARVRAAGKAVVLQAVSPEGITAALAAGADVLVVQGPAAGGHRAANAHWEEDTAATSLEELLACAAAAIDAHASRVLLIAAGGIASAADVARARAAGADMVQVGTALLRAEEAGTQPLHRRALREWADRPTATTRAFSGRMARGISNRVMEEFSAVAPAAYPELHYVTAPMKRAGDLEAMSLWAGTGFPRGVEAPAVDIIAALMADE